MPTIKLKYSEAVTLQIELSRLSVLSLPGKVKIKIYKAIDALEVLTRPFNKAKLELFKKYGTAQGSNFMIPEFTGNPPVPNPQYAQYLEEFEPMDTEVDITLEFLPAEVFKGDKEIPGDLRLVYKHLIP